MKKTIILIITILVIFNTMAQEKYRVAVFDPVSGGDEIDVGTKIAIREIISSTIVNNGEYSLVERSMLERVIEEQAFSNSGIVDDSQATEIGKLAGANKVIVSVITSVQEQYMISIKMIDVKTAAVEKQKVSIVPCDELIFKMETIARSIFTHSDSGAGVSVATIEEERNTDSEKDISATSENITLYLPSGSSVQKEAHSNNPINVYLDKKFIGSGTIGEGFKIVLENIQPGEHTLKFGSKRLGEMRFIKIDTQKYSYFEFGIRRWKYMGVEFYSVELIKQRRPHN